MPEISSVIILHGNDEFAISGHIDKLCSGLGDPSSRVMNVARFDGRMGLDFEALNNAVNAAPFLAPRRVVVLAHPITAFPTPEAHKKLIDLLEHIPPTTTIALVEYEELNEKHWLIRWAEVHAQHKKQASEAETTEGEIKVTVHAYTLPKRWEMPRWIEMQAKNLGGTINRDAAVRLSDMVGEDPRVAIQELTKLLTYANFARPVTLLDVEQVSFTSAQGNIFELVDALGLGDGKKAQYVLHQLLEDGEAFELWGMVIRQFRLLLQAREMLDEGKGIPQIQKELGLHEYVAQKITAQAKRFSLPQLESIHHKLLETDEGEKSSQVPLDLALDLLVVDLAKKETRATS